MARLSATSADLVRQVKKPRNTALRRPMSGCVSFGEGVFLGPRRDGYERRRPEETLLYRIVEEHWPTFRIRPANSVVTRSVA